jgi:general secretion pathway protein C
VILKGLIAATPEERALAIIGEKGRSGQEGVYAVGDEIPGQASIQGIFVDRVILLRAGELETLYLEAREEDRKARTTPPPAAGARGQQRLSRDYVEQRLANLPDLAKEVGVQVHNRDGVQYGFRLVSAQGSDFLSSLGLRSGDILYEVNGIRLSDASNAFTAYEQLRNAREIRLTFERDGVQESRIFSIQ